MLSKILKHVTFIISILFSGTIFANDQSYIRLQHEKVGNEYIYYSYINEDNKLPWEKYNISKIKGIIKAFTCKKNNNRSCIGIGHLYYGSNQNSKCDLLTYNSYDGGKIWNYKLISTVGTISGFSDITCNMENENVCIAVGGFTDKSNKGGMKPLLYISSQFGLNWHSIPLIALNEYSSLRAISCSSQGFCMAVGDSANYENLGTKNNTRFFTYASEDNGQTWYLNKLDIHKGTSYLNSIHCNSNKICIAVGYETTNKYGNRTPLIYRLTGNSEWSHINPIDSDGELNSVSCIKDGNICYSVGQSGSSHHYLIRSDDNGKSWNRLYLPPRKHLYAKGLVDYVPDSRDISLTSLKCDATTSNCIILGHATYIERKYNEKGITTRLPIMFISKDLGLSWEGVNPYGELQTSIIDSALNRVLSYTLLKDQ